MDRQCGGPDVAGLDRRARQVVVPLAVGSLDGREVVHPRLRIRIGGEFRKGIGEQFVALGHHRVGMEQRLEVHLRVLQLALAHQADQCLLIRSIHPSLETPREADRRERQVLLVAGGAILSAPVAQERTFRFERGCLQRHDRVAHRRSQQIVLDVSGRGLSWGTRIPRAVGGLLGGSGRLQRFDDLIVAVATRQHQRRLGRVEERVH